MQFQQNLYAVRQQPKQQNHGPALIPLAVGLGTTLLGSVLAPKPQSAPAAATPAAPAAAAKVTPMPVPMNQDPNAQATLRRQQAITAQKSGGYGSTILSDTLG